MSASKAEDVEFAFRTVVWKICQEFENGFFCLRHSCPLHASATVNDDDEFLVSIQDHSMEKQRELLDQEFETWRGKLEQIDDVCVIGVRI